MWFWFLSGHGKRSSCPLSYRFPASHNWHLRSDSYLHYRSSSASFTWRDTNVCLPPSHQSRRRRSACHHSRRHQATSVWWKSLFAFWISDIDHQANTSRPLSDKPNLIPHQRNNQYTTQVSNHFKLSLFIQNMFSLK